MTDTESAVVRSLDLCSSVVATSQSSTKDDPRTDKPWCPEAPPAESSSGALEKRRLGRRRFFPRGRRTCNSSKKAGGGLTAGVEAGGVAHILVSETKGSTRVAHTRRAARAADGRAFRPRRGGAFARGRCPPRRCSRYSYTASLHALSGRLAVIHMIALHASILV